MEPRTPAYLLADIIAFFVFILPFRLRRDFPKPGKRTL